VKDDLGLEMDVEQLEPCVARITVTVPDETVQKEMHRVARRIAKNNIISGFRRGKAPYHVILQRFGEGNILQNYQLGEYSIKIKFPYISLIFQQK